jgi:hypothetical protein
MTNLVVIVVIFLVVCISWMVFVLARAASVQDKEWERLIRRKAEDEERERLFGEKPE